MRISANVTSLAPDDPVGSLADLAAAADSTGLDTLWIPDHLQQVEPGRSLDDPVFESSAALAWIAARTERVRIGAMVGSVALRSPVLTVKTVTDLHVLSGGRAWFGLGAGYASAETSNLALDDPSTARRFDLLDDTLRLARHLWRDDRDAFEGVTVSIPQPLIRPLPRRHPRVLIGGMGERKTLRLVARYGDACNFFDVGDDVLRHKLEVLDVHLAEAGRSRSDIETTVSTRWSGPDPLPFLAHLSDLEALGFEHAVVLRDVSWTAADLELLLAAHVARGRRGPARGGGGARLRVRHVVERVERA